MNPPPPIAGAIVTYHPDADFERRLEAIARETHPLIVVDNTAEPATRDRLSRACTIHGAMLIANSENRGLAAALNQAFAA
ncbi:MAG: glycosyltransferase, partial [Opitutaceae bacterium]